MFSFRELTTAPRHAVRVAILQYFCVFRAIAFQQFHLKARVGQRSADWADVVVGGVNPVRVACVGSSITYGLDVDRSLSYPSQLRDLLPSGYEVRNFGVSATTVLRAGTPCPHISDGNKSYWAQPELRDVVDWSPQIIVIQFGNNDARPCYSDEFNNHYVSDYQDLIDLFLRSLPKPRLLLMKPPPLYHHHATLNQTRSNIVVPKAITQISQSRELEVVDVFSVFSERCRVPSPGRDFDCDWMSALGVHCTREGYLAIAAAVADAIKSSEPADLIARAHVPMRSHFVDGLDIEEQSDATIRVGQAIQMFVVSSSNGQVMTWVDQLHLMLKRLGYRVPVVDGVNLDVHRHFSPRLTNTCDDSEDFSKLETTRIFQGGWSSWAFAYDSTDDCKGGFRNISGYQVSCVNGPGCDPTANGGHDLYRVSDIAATASGTDITLLSTWINDPHQASRKPGCFADQHLSMEDVALLTTDSLRRVIRAIHARNPSTLVVVIGTWPTPGPHANTPFPSNQFIEEHGLDFAARHNKLIKSGIATEANTLFIEPSYNVHGHAMLNGIMHGHLNCRGDKLLATAIVDKLFKNKFLSRGLHLAPEEPSELCLANAQCATLAKECCQRSALCRVDWNGSCVPYSAGHY